jgi:A/G-specific adenine glycosylase
MLQQTRVAAVIPYYERFLENYPTCNRWRARKRKPCSGKLGGPRILQPRQKSAARREGNCRAARGHFPREYEAALALPGIGRYTAAAVLSIAYDAPLAVLDGNVARVLARIGAVRGDYARPALWRELEARRRICSLETLPAIGTKP